MLEHSQEIIDLREAYAAAQAQIAQLEAERLAQQRTDQLTGALMVPAFRVDATVELERARRSGAPLALILFEVDGLRALSAVHGATNVDGAVQALAALLRRGPSGRIVGRTGPGELAVMLPGTATVTALATARRVLANFAETVIPGLTGVTASAGVANAPGGIQLDALIAVAGGYLETAKSAGGGRVQGADRGVTDTLVMPPGTVIDAIARSLGHRDAYTGHDADSVVTLAENVATGMGLEVPQIAQVRTAALLHDIGKVAIPDSILHKPTKLDASEWALMREHPVIGERMLRAITGLDDVAQIVRHEHERWDGGGYPDGLTSDAIPVGSRILLACDAYNAMTSDRPYRTAMPRDEALGELHRRAGSQFDPRVAEVLIGHF